MIMHKIFLDHTLICDNAIGTPVTVKNADGCLSLRCISGVRIKIAGTNGITNGSDITLPLTALSEMFD